MANTSVCTQLVVRLLATGHFGFYEAVQAARFLEIVSFQSQLTGHASQAGDASISASQFQRHQDVVCPRLP